MNSVEGTEGSVHSTPQSSRAQEKGNTNRALVGLEASSDGKGRCRDISYNTVPFALASAHKVPFPTRKGSIIIGDTGYPRAGREEGQATIVRVLI